MTDIEQETLPSAQLTIGWKWFEYHAKQRLDIFKFFLTIYTAVAVGGSVLYDRGFFRLAMVLGGVNFLASWLFWRLDVRSRRLTGYGEDLLDAALEGERIPPRLNPIQRARIGGDGGIRFKTAFGLTYTMAAIAAASLCIISLSEGMEIKLVELLLSYGTMLYDWLRAVSVRQ